MKTRLLLAIPVVAIALATPASAQVSATIHIGPYGGHRGPVVVHEQYREVIVVPYESRRHGDYRRSGRDWRPVTVYVLGNRYYHEPYRSARPVVVYRYSDYYFLAPRDRDWNDYRVRYERDYWHLHRADGRNDRRDHRRDDRDDDDDDWRDDHRNDRGDDWRDRRRDDRRDDWRGDRRDDRWDDRRTDYRSVNPGNRSVSSNNRPVYTNNRSVRSDDGRGDERSKSRGASGRSEGDDRGKYNGRSRRKN